MKRVKILAVVLTIAIMMTGVAFALWDDSTVITNTAAMGELDVNISCPSPTLVPLSTMPGLDPLNEDYMDLNPLVWDHNSITVRVANMYPGAKYGLNFTIKNDGDVPFGLKDVKVEYVSGELALFDKISASLNLVQEHSSPYPDPVFCNVGMTSLSGLEAAVLAAARPNAYLYPSDELIGGFREDDGRIAMQVLVDEETITGSMLENKTVTFRITFNWQQCDVVQTNLT